MFGYAPPDGADLSEAFAELHDDMFLLSESAPNMVQIQREFILGLYRDVGLVNRLFVAEAGLKCLISLSGSTPKNWHKLNQLYDCLPPVVQTELQRAHSIVIKDHDVPDGAALIPSVVAVVKLYNDLYQELRYPKPDKDVSSIVSAWHNLGFLIDAILIVVMSHPLRGAGRQWSEVSIEE